MENYALNLARDFLQLEFILIIFVLLLVQDQLRLHEDEMKNLQEDYFNISGQLQAEKKKKLETETQIEKDREKHRTEVTLKNQEAVTHRKRLATWSVTHPLS